MGRVRQTRAEELLEKAQTLAFSVPLGRTTRKTGRLHRVQEEQTVAEFAGDDLRLYRRRLTTKEHVGQIATMFLPAEPTRVEAVSLQPSNHRRDRARLEYFDMRFLGDDFQIGAGIIAESLTAGHPLDFRVVQELKPKAVRAATRILPPEVILP